MLTFSSDIESVLFAHHDEGRDATLEDVEDVTPSGDGGEFSTASTKTLP